jgi:hypothetical protein
MNRTTVESVAVVVALTDPATPALRSRLARFADEVGPLGEVLLVDASGTSAGQEAAQNLANVRVISRPVGRLAPVLWRDGLLATDAALVALTTAQMTPRPGWLSALKDQLVLTNAAGVGGPIEPGLGLSRTDQAVALLRYSSYFPAINEAFLHIDPPGDNALYPRDCLMDVESAWINGFWEVVVHKALRDRGETLVMAESAVVTFEGGIGLRSMTRQRLRHAMRFGSGRSRGLGPLARLGRVVAAPLVPPLLCVRIARSLRERKMGRRPWLPALPRLIWLASAWAIGEAAGTLFPGSEPKFVIQKPVPATHLKSRSPGQLRTYKNVNP